MDAYPIVILELDESEGEGFWAFAPDLVGCLADGDTQEEALREIQSAICEWIDEARASGQAVPAPHSHSEAAESRMTELVDVVKQQSELIEQLQGQIQSLRTLTTSLIGMRDVDPAHGWKTRAAPSSAPVTTFRIVGPRAVVPH